MKLAGNLTAFDLTDVVDRALFEIRLLRSSLHPCSHFILVRPANDAP
jgi:hypothetical protein